MKNLFKAHTYLLLLIHRNEKFQINKMTNSIPIVIQKISLSMMKWLHKTFG